MVGLGLGLGRVHLRGEILLFNSTYWASRNSPTIVSSATHSLTNPSPNTGAKPSNHVKHGCRSCKKCADMALALIQCCPCVSCRSVLVVGGMSATVHLRLILSRRCRRSGADAEQRCTILRGQWVVKYTNLITPCHINIRIRPTEGHRAK